MTEVKAALYLRLSREDDDSTSESESITNQRAFLLGYAEDHGYSVSDIYIDDGFTGTNFDRPDFQRLLGDIETGKINLVLTKDLSRLGRDYIMTGHYVERYFPSRNVRYIAVNDGVDTFSNQIANDMTPFRAVFNDMYAKDISGKVRSALMTKKKSGKFIGSTAPFGYKKSPEDKNHLIIDEETALYVKNIFAMYLGGESILGIAKKLTEMRAPTPSQNKHLKATQKRFEGLWNDAIVKRILKNPTYAGHLTQNRVKKINYKVDKKIALPLDEWITIRNSHEAIIKQEDFDAAQQMLHIRNYSNQNRKGSDHLLTGLVYCEDCLSPMSTVKESSKRTYLVCSTWRKFAKLKLCSSHCIREDLVMNEISKQLKQLADRYIDRQKLSDDLTSGDGCETDRKLHVGLEKKLAVTKAAKLTLYKDKASGIITEEDYREFSKTLESEQRELEEQISAISEHINNEKNDEKAIAAIEKQLSFEELNRETLLMLISKIYIGKDKKISMEFTFQCPG